LPGRAAFGRDDKEVVEAGREVATAVGFMVNAVCNPGGFGPLGVFRFLGHFNEDRGVLVYMHGKGQHTAIGRPGEGLRAFCQAGNFSNPARCKPVYKNFGALLCGAHKGQSVSRRRPSRV